MLAGSWGVGPGSGTEPFALDLLEAVASWQGCYFQPLGCKAPLLLLLLLSQGTQMSQIGFDSHPRGVFFPKSIFGT